MIARDRIFLFSPHTNTGLLFLLTVKFRVLVFKKICEANQNPTLWPKWPTGIYLLDFVCSGIQFYLLLSPYLCFVSLLYLDLYVLGDDALIS